MLVVFSRGRSSANLNNNYNVLYINGGCCYKVLNSNSLYSGTVTVNIVSIINVIEQYKYTFGYKFDDQVIRLPRY